MLMTNSRYSPQAVANYFLKRGEQEAVPIDAMKLQKLTYFAHGWYLAIHSQPLIDEPVEAWQYGPVIPSIYHEFKRFGSQPITRQAFRLEGSAIVLPTIPDSDAETMAVLDKIWTVYKDFTGIQLSNLTHQPGTPWSLTRESTNRSRGVDVSDEVIAQYFRKVARRSKT